MKKKGHWCADLTFDNKSVESASMHLTETNDDRCTEFNCFVKRVDENTGKFVIERPEDVYSKDTLSFCMFRLTSEKSIRVKVTDAVDVLRFTPAEEHKDFDVIIGNKVFYLHSDKGVPPFELEHATGCVRFYKGGCANVSVVI